MIGKNIFNHVIIFILFVHVILSIFLIKKTGVFTKKDNMVACLSSLDENDTSVDSGSSLKSNDIYDIAPISSYPEFSSKPICKAETEEKVVSFSFDDGYNHSNILDIINILKENGNLKTTFFFCGHSIDSDEKSIEEEYTNDREHSVRREHSVKVVYDNGHEIGNHSNSHANFKKLSKEAAKNEIVICNEKIKNITGNDPVVFRFPYGAYNQNSLDVVKDLKMFPVQWSIDTLDWKTQSSSESICDKIINNLHSGAIILMHTSGKNTPQALRMVIPKILELGYKIVPVSDLINKKF